MTFCFCHSPSFVFSCARNYVLNFLAILPQNLLIENWLAGYPARSILPIRMYLSYTFLAPPVHMV